MIPNVIALDSARPRQEPRLVASTVAGSAAGQWLLADPLLPRAHRAVSCLVEPQAGDTVLVTHDPHGACYILAVLSRPQAHMDGTVVLPGGSTLREQAGTLAIESEAVRLSGRQAVHIATPALNVDAAAAQVRVAHWMGWFDTVESYAVQVSLVTKSLSSRIGRLLQRTVESLRTTERLDETRAGRVKVAVQGHHQVKAAHLTATAEGFVKIDGQKINLG